ncbi:hypothetical protein WA026_021034 [Henosepilachna vigintioctopunctata]|uniref:SRR1-like domain-containing protein n=1 Tax=Henosepilachna vigintioctopunctata TaxID=420089 RepID=A0AAW1V317_9CUCU
MSADHCQECTFIRVTRKKKSSERKKKAATIDLESVPLTDVDKKKAIRHIEQAIEDISQSDLFQSIIASLKEGVNILGNPAIKEIICLGLGKVGEFLRSKYQLAFLLKLRDLYNIELKIFDPVFSEDDQYLLRHFNITVLGENLEGKYRNDQSTTIFFLPHCPKQLTNNILWINWGLNLHYCILICNSFAGLIENNTKKYLIKSAEYILKIYPYTVELAIANTFKFYDIFNDTAIHIFPQNRLNLLPIDFWKFQSEPRYTEEDCEFIRKPSLT